VPFVGDLPPHQLSHLHGRFGLGAETAGQDHQETDNERSGNHRPQGKPWHGPWSFPKRKAGITVYQSLPSTSPPLGVSAAFQVVGEIPLPHPLTLASPSSAMRAPLLKLLGTLPSHPETAGRIWKLLPATGENLGVYSLSTSVSL